MHFYWAGAYYYPPGERFYGRWAFMRGIRWGGSVARGTLAILPPPPDLLKYGIHSLLYDAATHRLFAVHATCRCTEGRHVAGSTWDFALFFCV